MLSFPPSYYGGRWSDDDEARHEAENQRLEELQMARYTFKYQGYGDLNEFDDQPIEIIRDLTPADRDEEAGIVEPYSDLVKLIRLPNGAEIGARADEIIEHEEP